MATAPGELIERDERGRYRPGYSGGGRKPGSRNRASLDLAEIRQRIVDSWATCNGNQLLREVARDKPLEYLKLVASLLPKMIEGDGTSTQIIIVVRSDAGMAFAETLQQQAQRLPALESPHVIDALRAVNPDLDFNGVIDDSVAGGEATSEYDSAT